MTQLETVCGAFQPFDSVRSVLVEKAGAVFTGIVGSYGKIRGAPSAIFFIGDMRDPGVYEKIGYTGEGIILEASSLELGTCWIGKSFDRATASSFTDLLPHERVIAVTPVGYAEERVSFEERVLTGFGRAHRRKPVGALSRGMPMEEWPEWVRAAIEAARLAPSAVNRQPWRFSVTREGISISVDDMRDTYGIPKRLDCGIAMLHIEIAAGTCGVRGTWELLDSPDVARFTPTTR